MRHLLRAAIAVAAVCLPATSLFAQGTTNNFTNWGPTHPGMMNAWGYYQTDDMPYGNGRLDAGLYPCPRPDVPYEVGGTLITNPAFDPHEMLYPHRTRAVYPPFYFKKGCFTHDGYVIGTEVRVKYRSHYAPFSFFFPPRR